MEDMLPLMLCAGVGREVLMRGDVMSFEEESVLPGVREGL